MYVYADPAPWVRDGCGGVGKGFRFYDVAFLIIYAHNDFSRLRDRRTTRPSARTRRRFATERRTREVTSTPYAPSQPLTSNGSSFGSKIQFISLMGAERAQKISRARNKSPAVYVRRVGPRRFDNNKCIRFRVK